MSPGRRRVWPANGYITTGECLMAGRLIAATDVGNHTEQTSLHCSLSQKNDTDVAHYNFNAHQPILVIFGRDIAEGTSY